MSQVKKPSARERIITASADLFYAHDAATVGVDRICEVADVSKRTLYKYFPTKEELVSAALVAEGAPWGEEFAAVLTDDPVENIRGIFKVLERHTGREDFYGCPMMNATTELRDSHAPARATAKEYKNKMYVYFEEQATMLGVSDPRKLAEQLLLLFDGCNAWMVMRQTFPTSVYEAIDTLLNV